MYIELEKTKRNIQLFKLGIGELTGVEVIIYRCLVDNLSGLNTYTLPKYQNCLFFGKDDTSLNVKYNSKESTLYIDTNIIWGFILIREHLSYKDLCSLIKYWINTELNIAPEKVIFTSIFE